MKRNRPSPPDPRTLGPVVPHLQFRQMRRPPSFRHGPDLVHRIPAGRLDEPTDLVEAPLANHLARARGVVGRHRDRLPGAVSGRLEIDPGGDAKTLVLPELPEQPFEVLRPEAQVAIQLDDKIGLHFPDRGVSEIEGPDHCGPRLPCPRLRVRHQSDEGIGGNVTADDLRRAVAGTVVHDHPQCRTQGLSDNGLECQLDISLLILDGGNDDVSRG